MAKITNIYNLPSAIYEIACREYTPDPKRYSATTILKGVREILLSRRHDSEISIDCSELVWAIFGTAVHKVFEEAAERPEEFKEEKIHIPINDKGYVLSGIFDLFNTKDKKIIDYKSTSVYKVLNNSFDDYKKQLLIYAWMLKKIGFECDKGEIIMILKDWRKSEARRVSGYPPNAVHKVNFIFTEKDFHDIEKFIIDKFNEIEENVKLSDNELPLCSKEERWGKEDKFAVMVNGNKKAARLLNTEEEAIQWMAQKKKGDFIEKRVGVDNKCLDYCSCCEFCSYWQEHYQKGEASDEN